MPNPEAEAALEILALYSVSGPIITTFRESVNLDQAEVLIEEDVTGVVAPGSNYGDLISVALCNIRGVGSLDMLKMAFGQPSLETSPEKDEGFEVIGWVQTGYTCVGSSIGFRAEAGLAEEFDPSEPQARWILGRISRVGELISQDIEENGQLPEYELNSDGALAVVEEVLEGMKRRSEQMVEELRRRGIDLRMRTSFEIETSKPPDSI